MKEILLLLALASCKNKEMDGCIQIEPKIAKNFQEVTFKAFRIYFFSFNDPNFLKELDVQLNGQDLTGSIVAFGDSVYQSKFYSIRNDITISDQKLKVLLDGKCFELKINPDLRNYLIHLESKDSVTCYGNNEEFIGIE